MMCLQSPAKKEACLFQFQSVRGNMRMDLLQNLVSFWRFAFPETIQLSDCTLLWAILKTILRSIDKAHLCICKISFNRLSFVAKRNSLSCLSFYRKFRYISEQKTRAAAWRCDPYKTEVFLCSFIICGGTQKVNGRSSDCLLILRKIHAWMSAGHSLQNNPCALTLSYAASHKAL